MEATRPAPTAPEVTLSERVGRCPSCAAFTYDVTGLSEEDVRRLILATEGRALNRLVRRSDGRVMSVDCGHFKVRVENRGQLALVFGAALALTLPALWFSQWVRPSPSVPLEPIAPVPERPFVETPLTPPIEAEPDLPLVTLDHEAVPWRPAVSDASPPVTLDSDQLARANQLDVHFADVWLTTDKRARAADIMPFLERRLPALRECYFRTLARDPLFRGSLSVSGHLDAAGGLSNLHVDVPNSGPAPRAPLPAAFKSPAGVPVPTPSPRAPRDAELTACAREVVRTITADPGWTHRNGTLSFRVIFSGSF